MAVNRIDVSKKLEEIGDISISWVSGDKPRKDFKTAVRILALEVGQREIDPTVLAALDDFSDKLSVYLKNIDYRGSCLYEEMMDALPDND